EGADEVADLDAVVVAEQGARADGLVVEEGAVSAFQVFQVALALEARDLGVGAADGRVVDDDVALGAAAEHDLIFPLQRNFLPRVGTFENLEMSHLVLLSEERMKDEG